MAEARDVIARALPGSSSEANLPNADFVIECLEAAGFRILGPDELDPVTLEAAAGIADDHVKASCSTPDGSQTSAMRLGASSIATAIRNLGRQG